MKIRIQTAGRATIICLIVVLASAAGQSQSPISEEKKKRLGNFDPVDIFSPARPDGGKVRERKTPPAEAVAPESAVRRIPAARKNPVSSITGTATQPSVVAESRTSPAATPSMTARSESHAPSTAASASLTAPSVSITPTHAVASPVTQPVLSRASLESAGGAFTASRDRDHSTEEFKRYMLPITLVLLLVASVTLILMVLKLLKLRSQDS